MDRGEAYLPSLNNRSYFRLPSYTVEFPPLARAITISGGWRRRQKRERVQNRLILLLRWINSSELLRKTSAMRLTEQFSRIYQVAGRGNIATAT